jgi:transcriptional regulator with XRE-family HTH domain
MLTKDQLAELRRSPCRGPNLVHRAIELAGTTQTAVAEAIGTTQPHISAVALGKQTRLPLATAQALAKHFGCLIEDLFPDRKRRAS